MRRDFEAEQYRRYLFWRPLRATLYFAVGAAFAGLVGYGVYLLMSWAQPFFRPEVPEGGWVIDPPAISRQFFSFYSPAVLTLPFVYYLRNRWFRVDAENGHPRPVLERSRFFWFRAVASMAFFYGLMLLSFYMAFACFDVLSKEGIDVSRFDGKVYTYDQIVAINYLRSNQGIDNRAEYGPRCTVVFQDNWSTDWGHENGLTEQEVVDLMGFLYRQSRVPITEDPRAQPR